MNGEYRRVPLALTTRLRHARPEQRSQDQQHGRAHELVHGSRAEPDRLDSDEERWRLSHERSERGDSPTDQAEREGTDHDG